MDMLTPASPALKREYRGGRVSCADQKVSLKGRYVRLMLGEMTEVFLLHRLEELLQKETQDPHTTPPTSHSLQKINNRHIYLELTSVAQSQTALGFTSMPLLGWESSKLYHLFVPYFPPLKHGDVIG